VYLRGGCLRFPLVYTQSNGGREHLERLNALLRLKFQLQKRASERTKRGKKERGPVWGRLLTGLGKGINL